jgi:hypothetical protein
MWGEKKDFENLNNAKDNKKIFFFTNKDIF